MSKIKNGGFDQYGAGPFEQQQFGTAGVEGVKWIYWCLIESILCKLQLQSKTTGVQITFDFVVIVRTWRMVQPQRILFSHAPDEYYVGWDNSELLLKTTKYESTRYLVRHSSVDVHDNVLRPLQQQAT